MFVAADVSFKETYYLLTAENGGPLLEEIVPFVGDPIAASGVLQRRGDLLILKLDLKSIKRL